MHKVKTDFDILNEWFLDRIKAGENEVIGSLDCFVDNQEFCWFITKVDENTFVMTTESNPIPFARGEIDANGEAKIMIL